MALVNTNEMLAKARERAYAAANFDIVDGNILRGVMKAAEKRNAPVILAYAEAFEDVSPMEKFAPWMISEAQNAAVPAALHLDHGRTLDYIKKGVDNGFTSVMLDASDKPLEENIKLTKKVVELCAPHNISVESELGHVGGLDGYAYDESDDGYTVVEEAVRFVKETGVNSLAVSIGTVHGVYRSEPRLNFKRLTELAAALDIPLVLHGGSGLSNEDFKKVIAGGISKVNIYTDLLIKAKDAIKAHIDDNYLELSGKITDAAEDEAVKKIDLFGSANRG